MVSVKEETTEQPLGDWNTPPLDHLSTFDVALDAITFNTLALTSAIAKLEYDEGSRARRNLDHAFACAHKLLPAVPDGTARAEATAQLRQLLAIARPLIRMGPSPSKAAVMQAQLGDLTRWDLERQAWIASRHASRPDGTLARRRRRDTLADSPTSIREAGGVAPAPELSAKKGDMS